MPKVELQYPGKEAHTGSYSTAILIDGWLYVSGHGPLDFQTGEVIHGTIEEEVRLTLTHIGKVLAAGGCGFDDVVKCTVHLSNIHDFDRYDTVYREFFTGVRPTRTTVQSVLGGGMKVEIDCVARVPGKP